MRKISINNEAFRPGSDSINRFQIQLANFVSNMDPFVVVETGSGLSTYRLLEKLSPGCQLFSIDPEPYCQFELQGENYQLIKKKSFLSLAELYINTGAWDVFLHDSDHWIECQMYEYEMAWQCVKPGGYIFSDDPEWNGHFAWKKFLDKYSLSPFTVGDIQGTQKPFDAPAADKKDIKKLSDQLWIQAKETGKKWREENNNPPCWTCDDELTEYWKFPN